MSDSSNHSDPGDCTPNSMNRRGFIRTASAGAAVAATAAAAEAAQPPAAQPSPTQQSYLTNPADFRDVSRGDPRPYTLTGKQLEAARLTPATWRLEIVSDGTTQIATPLTIANKNAIDLPALEKMGQQHGKRFLKAMQC